MKSRRNPASRASRTANPDARCTLARLLPCLLLLTLSLPCFSLPFLWDDFDFLGRSWNLRPAELLPDAQTLYYRPISRELYFGLVTAVGAAPLLGHILNAVVLAVAVWLLFLIGREVSGVRAGVIAALVFASMGALPTLVGWVSGIQDALAIAFVVGAILAELRGSAWLGPMLLGCGALSKESALILMPAALLAGSWRRTKAHGVKRVAIYGGLAAALVAIHPATRIVLGARGLPPGGDAALSFPRLDAVGAAALSTLNVPLGSVSVEDARAYAPILLTALGVVWLTCHFVLRGRTPLTDTPCGLTEPLTLAGLLFVPSILLTSIPTLWSPYYACMPALGVALAGGTLLARARALPLLIVLMVYTALGVFTRTAALSPTTTTEKNLRASAAALDSVEKAFRRLHASFPAGSHLYVSIQVAGHGGLHRHLYRFQPLRVWYRDPSLFVLDPNRYRAGGSADFLFWISPTLDVGEVDVETMLARTSGPLPEVLEYQKTLRTFALGQAAGGHVDRAVHILLTMPGRPPRVRAYDRRTAAAVLFASGRDSSAATLLEGVPVFDRMEALDAVLAVVHEPVPGLELDEGAMRAFGLSPSDLEANRDLMRAFVDLGFSASAVRFARRVQALSPGDSEAKEVLAKWGAHTTATRITIPIEHD